MDWIAEYLPQLVYWAITGALAVVCGTLWKRVQKTHAQEAVERNAIREGVIAMLHNTLYRIHRIYMDQGYCTLGDKKSIESIYEAYSKLGGNGTGKQAYEEMMSLPTEPMEK